MLWKVKLNDKEHIFDLPDEIVDGVPFTVNSNSGQKFRMKWNQKSGAISFTEESAPLERDQALDIRWRSVTKEGDDVSSVKLEIGGKRVQRLSANVSRYLPGTEHREKLKAAKGETVRSPMTGKVLSVKIKEGQAVAAGTVLLTIEAMKMENKIFAKSAGSVTNLSVKEGDMVSVGKQLLTIKQ